MPIYVAVYDLQQSDLLNEYLCLAVLITWMKLSVLNILEGNKKYVLLKMVKKKAN